MKKKTEKTLVTENGYFLLQTVKQTDTQTEVVQFVAHKGILSANLSESISKGLWLTDPF